MEEAFKHIVVVVTDLSAVYQVEELEAAEHVEDVSEMLGLGLRFYVQLLFWSDCSLGQNVEVIWSGSQNGDVSAVIWKTSNDSTEEHDENHHDDVEHGDT